MRRDLVVSIICTNNRVALQECLASLPDACADITWQAVVIDNASTDGTAEMVRHSYPWAKLIVNTIRQGFSANHNKVLLPALREGHARYLLILNDDVILDRDALTKLVRAADDDPRVGALGPALRGRDGVPQRSFFPFPGLLAEISASLGLPRSTPRQEDGWLNGSCILFRSIALQQVGSLDEDFFLFFEDTDISLRLREAGWRVAVASESTMVHLEHQTVSRPAPGSPMEKQMQRSRYLYFRKHKSKSQAALLTVITRMVLALRAAKAVVWGAVTRDASERSAARLLVQLMVYSPSERLAHETASRATRTSDH